LSKSKQKIMLYYMLFIIVGSLAMPKIAMAILPVNDAYEPNDYYDEAALIYEGIYTNLVLEEYDLDWFEIAVPANQMIQVLVEPTDYSENDEFSIVLYEKVGDYDYTYLDEDYYWYYSSDVQLSLQWYSETAISYYIKINPYYIDTDLTYQMEIDFITIHPDVNEPNEDYQEATPISTGTYEGLTLIENDEDWFEIDIYGPTALKAKVELTDVPYDDYYIYVYLYMEDYDYGYIRVGRGYLYSGRNEIIGIASANFEDAETIFIEVDPSYMTGEIEYTLTVETFDPYNDPAFDYGISAEDELVYTSTTNFNFSASDYLYSEIENYIDEMIYYNTDEEIIASDFSLQDMVSDFSDFFSTTHDIQFTISDVYNLDLQNEEFSTDYIEGSILMGGEDGIWQYPNDYLVEYYEEWEDILEPYLDGDAFDDFEDEMDYYINEIRGFDEEYFSDINLVSNLYVENSTDYFGFDSIDDLDDGTQFPELPMENFFPFVYDENDYYYGDEFNYVSYMWSEIAMFAPLCYPKDFSFQDYYDYGLEAYSYAQALAEQQEANEGGEDPFPVIGGPELIFSVDEIINMVGVSSYFIDAQSISATWNMNGIDFSDLEDFYGYEDFDMQSEFEEELTYLGIDFDSSTAQASFSIEYDRNMVLASIVLYVDVTVGFDDEYMDESLDLGGETVTISFSQSFTKEGLEPPSKEDIASGDVGEDRSLNDFSLFAIPSFPIFFLGGVSLISVVALIYIAKHRK